jgi:hypothetical protein
MGKNVFVKHLSFLGKIITGGFLVYQRGLIYVKWDTLHLVDTMFTGFKMSPVDLMCRFILVISQRIFGGVSWWERNEV